MRGLLYTAAAVAVALTLFGGLAVLLSVPHRQDESRALGLTPGAAARDCKAAVEHEATGRAARGNERGTSATITVAGVEFADPVRSSGVWRVDGTMHFMIVTMLGAVPTDVYVTCVAGRSGTTVINRV